MVHFNNDLLKKYISPNIDQKLNITLPDLREERGQADKWMQTYFLNSMLTGNFPDATRRYAESIIARIQIAYSQYASSRTLLIDYDTKWQLGNPGIGRYLAAVGESESLFINIQTIYDLLNKFLGAKQSLGGRENRTWIIANRIKHNSEDIQKNRMPGPGMPLWLTPSGYCTVDANVSYVEIFEQVKLLARIADCLAFPSEAVARFSALDAEYKNDPNYEANP